MASLNSMKSDLSRWNSTVSSLNGEIKNLKQRKKDIENLRSALRKAANDNSSDVNNKIRTTGQKLETGIEYGSKESLLDSILSGKNEGGLDSDGFLSDADRELQKELRDCEGKLGSKESELSQAKTRVSSLQTSIRQEEKRQWDENLKKLFGG